MEIIEATLVEPVEPVRRPWGFWATLGLSLVIIVTFIVAQTVVTLAFMAVSGAMKPQAVVGSWKGPPDSDPRVTGFSDVVVVEQPADLSANGLLLAIATWTTTPLCVALTVLFARICWGWSVRDYLALHRAPAKTFALWLSLTVVFIIVCESISCLVGRPLIHDYTRKTCETALWAPLLWSALVVAAPLFEETFFRGFMYRGIESSKVGVAGAIIITSFAWTVLHVQYDLFVLGVIFLGGLLFGVARWKSQSLYVTMAMHFLWNLISIVEYEVCVRWGC